jgi:transposase InsO family protein/transposase-like protein
MAQKVVVMEAKLLAVFTSGLNLNVSALCRQLKISRDTFYRYRRRFEAEGPSGLVRRSRRPRSSPRATSVAMEEEIVRLRKELEVDNGAQAIAWHLARRAPEGGPIPSARTVHRILVRRGMVLPQPEKRPRASWRRFEWPRPNDAWQIDATAWALADGTAVWIMDVLDDHSRVLVAARVAEGPTAAAAWDAFSRAVVDWGLPARVMSDNGLCFTGRLHGRDVDFERQLRAMGITHLPSSPGHPQTCGKLERSHLTTKRWLATQPPARDHHHLQHQLDQWRRLYNHHRPHKAAGGRTPLERWQAGTPATPGPPIDGPRRASLHKVSTAGHIGWGRYNIAIGTPLAGHTVLVIAQDHNLKIWGQPGHIRTLTIDPTRRYQPRGQPTGPAPCPQP